MRESRPDQQQSADTPVERPTWRFSGRRGTPVHLREQAPATLPREIREAITKLAREQSGEVAASGPDRGTRSEAPRAAAQRPTVSLADAQEARAEGKSVPVAAAPVPVERRARRREDARPSASTTIVGSASPPGADAPPEDSAAATAAPEPTPAAKPKKSRRRSRRGRGRSRSRSKSTEPPGVESTDSEPAHRLLAGDREVPANEAASIEPALEPALPPTVDPEVVAPEPVGPEVVAPVERETEVEAPVESEVEVEPTVTPQPEPVVELDIPGTSRTEEASAGQEWQLPLTGATEGSRQAAWELGRLPILLEQVEIPPASVAEPEPEREPTSQPASNAEPRPSTAPEPAAEPERVTQAPAAAEREQVEADIATAATQRSDGWQAPRRRVARTDAAAIELRPIAWRPVGDDPTPRPLPVADEPQADRPAAIDRLDATLDARPALTALGLARAREHGDPGAGRAPAIRASDARHRLTRRRRDLDTIVDSLGELAAGARRGSDG